MVEDVKADAIETGESELGSGEQVAAAGLEEDGNGVLGKAVFNAPGLAAKAGERGAWLQCTNPWRSDRYRCYGGEAERGSAQ